jgi:hypothetical protein
MPPIKKLTREQELKAALNLHNLQLKHDLQVAEQEARRKIRDALFASTSASGVVGQVRNERVAAARKALDVAKKEIANELVRAQRKLQSDFDKATNDATQAFEAIRADADAAQAEKGEPISALYHDTETALLSGLEEKRQLLMKTYAETTKAEREELEKIIDAQKAAHAAVQAAKSTKQAQEEVARAE